MNYFLFDHRRHKVRHRPHAFTDLSFALQSALEADVHVPILVGIDPGRFFHVDLTNHWARMHRGMHLIARPVEKPSINESNPFRGSTDTRLQVDGRAPFFVHDAYLHGVTRQIE